MTENKPNLIGFDVKTSSIITDIELPFTDADLSHAGAGQALDIDPHTGDLISVGQADAGHHFVIRVEFKTKKITVVANISKDVPSVAAMPGQGGGNTLDYKRQVEYINLGMSEGGRSIIATFRIDLTTGAVTVPSPGGLFLYGLHFDAKTDRIYGFGPSIYPPGAASTTTTTNNNSSSSSNNDNNDSKLQSDLELEAKKPIHSLAYLDAADPTKIKVVGGIPGYFLLQGAVVTVDPVKRRFYTLLQPTNNVTGWVPSNDCAKSPFPCQSGALCCADPTKTSKGACYKVSDCSTIHDGGDVNMSQPFQLVGVNLDTAEVETHPDVCVQIRAGSQGDCPWSIFAADALF
jgi:hypothetical protein